MDKKDIAQLLEYILESVSIIERRFEAIQSADDFLDSDEGIDRLDAISMRLQSIGEALKNIYKRDKMFLTSVESDEYWSKIIKTREIISHHYIDIDAEIIYMICQDKMDELKKNITILKNEKI